jgi:hypothetical protein
MSKRSRKRVCFKSSLSAYRAETWSIKLKHRHRLLTTEMDYIRCSAKISRMVRIRNEISKTKTRMKKDILQEVELQWSRGSSVGIATGYGLDRSGRPRGLSSSPGRVKNFLFSTTSRPALWPTQPPNQWVPAVLSPGGKAAGA